MLVPKPASQERCLMVVVHTQPKGSIMTEQLRDVLNMVRHTGMSAHPTNDFPVSEVVTIVAIARDCNPVALQAEVNAWADHIRR